MTLLPAPEQAAASRHGALRELPMLAAAGAVQMAVDEALLDDALFVTARRYVWTPPALSLGKFQRFPREHLSQELPFDVVRRPSGGRAVLHGEGFEWSFAVAFPPGSLPGRRVDDAYEVVSAALAESLGAAGVELDAAREQPYRSSALCFASGLRHDIFAGAGKVAAVAQVRRGGAALVHGSVLERRPPERLVAAVERLLGEPWQGDGLAATGAEIPAAGAGSRADAVWAGFVRGLAETLGCLTPSAGAGPPAAHR